MTNALHPIETAPAGEVAALVDRKLSQVITHARAHSPFYAERLGDRPITGVADLPQLPILNKDDFMAASPPHGEGTLTGPFASAYIFRSGGSTGEPKFSVFSTEEFRAYVTHFLRSYHAVGLRAHDRVANLFACGSLYASFVFVNRMLEEMGALNFPITTAMPAEAVARHAQLFGFTALLGFPSWLLQVAEAFGQAGVRVEKVFYAGEHLYDEERRFLHQHLGARTIHSAGYGAVDTGLMGYQCEHAHGGVHHVLSDHTVLEFVDPETFEPVAPGDEGLILVSNLDRYLQPIIRYNIGDMGRLVPGACACGRSAPRFELLRRGDDVLRVGYANLTYDEVAAAFASVGEIGSAVQMVKEREARRDRLTFRVELRDPAFGGSAELAARLGAALEQAKPDVAKLLASGYLHPLAFEFLPPGGIPRLPVTGKFKRTLDLSR